MTKKELTEIIDILSEKLTQAVKELDLIKAKHEPTPEQDLELYLELYKWLPISDDVYWTQEDMQNTPGIRTLVTDGLHLYTYQTCMLGWNVMVKRGWKYMRIKQK